MSNYLLTKSALVILSAMAWACLAQNTSKQAAQPRDLQERLAESEYIVERGELVRRPQGSRSTSTSLTHDQEFQVMKRSLEASKVRLKIPDGSGVILIDGKDFYEVVVGNSPSAERIGPNYSAKIMLDKKTLDVAQVLVNPMKSPDEAAVRTAQFRDLQERLAKSEYVVEKGELVRRPQSSRSTSTPLTHDQEFQVMKKSLAVAKAKLKIPYGAGVILIDGREYYEVVIGSPSPAETLGPDYTAKVLVDKKNLDVVQVLAGG